jgi:Glycosyl transferase family 11
MYITPAITAINSKFLSKYNTGLGNVLFQIASCYGLAKMTNRTVSWNKVIEFGDILHNLYGLNHKDTIFRKCWAIAEVKFDVFYGLFTDELDTHLIDSLKHINKHLEVRSYLENFEYFNFCRDEICELFSIDDSSLEQIKESFPILFDSRYTTISIHFRGIEYINGIVGNKPWDYSFYKRAVDYYKNRISNVIFIIFSDEIDKIELDFLGTSPYEKIHHSKDYIELWCMTMCKHNIISRSTFSWWGAYLNDNPEKTVLYNYNDPFIYQSLFTSI